MRKADPRGKPIAPSLGDFCAQAKGVPTKRLPSAAENVECHPQDFMKLKVAQDVKKFVLFLRCGSHAYNLSGNRKQAQSGSPLPQKTPARKRAKPPTLSEQSGVPRAVLGGGEFFLGAALF